MIWFCGYHVRRSNVQLRSVEESKNRIYDRGHDVNIEEFCGNITISYVYIAWTVVAEVILLVNNILSDIRNSYCHCYLYALVENINIKKVSLYRLSRHNTKQYGAIVTVRYVNAFVLTIV